MGGEEEWSPPWKRKTDQKSTKSLLRALRLNGEEMR
jgi:hypothetical protein